MNWRERISIGDYLFIQGVQFKVVPTMMRKRKPTKSAEDESEESASRSKSRRNESSNGKAASESASEAYAPIISI